MQTAALQSSMLSPEMTQAPAQQRGAAGFMASLGASLKPGEGDKQSEQQQAEDAAQKLVASAFLKPMFDQLRENTFKTKFFDGGRGEKAFTQRLHTRLGDRLSKQMDLPLTDAVTRFVMQKGAASDSVQQTGNEVDRHG